MMHSEDDMDALAAPNMADCEDEILDIRASVSSNGRSTGGVIVSTNREKREFSCDDRRPSVETCREALSARGELSLKEEEGPGGFERKDLAFDLNQPWQRSLIRELDNIVSPVEQRRHRGDRLLLGHSESGDFAMSFDGDDFTVNTDASSTVPNKPQVIHRIFQRHADALMDDDATLDSTGDRKLPAKGWPFGLPESPRSAQEERNISSTMLIPNEEEEKRDPQFDTDRQPDSTVRDTNGFHPIPNEFPMPRGKATEGSVELNRVPAFEEEQAGRPNWLEMEVTEEEEAQMLSAYADEGAGCLCWGYNVLDFWLPPPAPAPHKKMRYVQKKKKSRLFRVDEGLEESASPHKETTPPPKELTPPPKETNPPPKEATSPPKQNSAEARPASRSTTPCKRKADPSGEYFDQRCFYESATRL